MSHWWLAWLLLALLWLLRRLRGRRRGAPVPSKATRLAQDITWEALGRGEAKEAWWKSLELGPEGEPFFPGR